ncbi:MAG: Gfo/Idh/MocA family oxidoreductase [Oscillospiraceae bacterium]|jgi:predicted dehydrogenase|nr:Gfo/Idh/MocA family oxidoreductase [Oscillospiraceae bacterium]
MERKIGVGIIGFGGMGSFHARQLRALMPDDVIVVGVFDIKEERQEYARKNDWFSFASREDLLNAPEIDLVVVATPNDLHKEIVIDVLRHGKNVISEKPVTMTSADLEDMIAVAEETGKLFTVHQNRRWDPDYLTVKHIFDNNTLGRVFQIESRVHGSRGIPGDWRNRKAQGGGMLLDWGIHLLDQMLMLMEHNRLLTVYAQLTNVTNEECDDGFRVIVLFEGGYSFLVEVLTNNFIELPRWYVCGENGTAIVRDWNLDGEIVMVSDWENRDSVPIQAGVGITKTMAPRTDETIERFPLPDYDSDGTKNWIQYYHNIVAVLRGEEKQLITYNQQRRLIRLIEAIFESGETNRVVAFEDLI